jgi:cytochrome c oxidase subunit 1
MSRAATADAVYDESGGKNYINAEKGVVSWLTTVDHKRIGLMYLVSTLTMFMIAGIFALILRIELMKAGEDFLTPAMYNQAFTLHGAMMVFLFIIPAIPGGLGNFILPIMIGAKDVAFPKLNLLSLYLYWTGSIFTASSIVSTGLDTGWTFYVPYSTTVSQTSVIAVTFGAFILGFSSILTGLNFIVTIHKLRAPGVTWYRMPLMLWAIYATSIVQILATPVLAITLLLLILERAFQVGIFDPKLGGDPVLFQHFFWFYSHPAVYIMILPGMGIISDIIAVHSHRRIFGYKAIAFSSVAIALIGFLVWGHHMFTSGPERARLDHLLVHHLLRGRAVRREGLQLDQHDVGWEHLLEHADALRDELPVPVHHRRSNRTTAWRMVGRRSPPARHVLRGRPLPLRHDGRGGHRVHRRAVTTGGPR